MSQPSPNQLTSALEYLHLALRYIASGFTAVAAYMFLYNIPSEGMGKDSWFLLFLTAAIGALTYALHFATLDKEFYGWTALRCIRKYKATPPGLEKLILTQDQLSGKNRYSSPLEICKIKKRDLLFSLATNTYIRQTSGDPSIRQIQQLMDKRLALLNFLYCSFYQVAAVLTYFLIVNRWGQSENYPNQSIRAILLAAAGLVIIISALIFNRRICSREIWVIEYCQQSVSGGGHHHSGGVQQSQAGGNANSIKNLLDQVEQNLSDINKEVDDTRTIIG